jgi:hypothetical protein
MAANNRGIYGSSSKTSAYFSTKQVRIRVSCMPEGQSSRSSDLAFVAFCLLLDLRHRNTKCHISIYSVHSLPDKNIRICHFFSRLQNFPKLGARLSFLSFSEILSPEVFQVICFRFYSGKICNNFFDFPNSCTPYCYFFPAVNT